MFAERCAHWAKSEFIYFLLRKGGYKRSENFSGK